jgi:hypothetical protein
MKYLILFVFGMLFSCNKETPKSDVVDTQVDIIIEDSNGNNLLSGTTPSTINVDSIKLMYLINGNTHTVYNEHLDCQRNVCYIGDAGSERVRIFPNDVAEEEYPITYINWGNGDTDTLKCHFVRKDNGNESSVVCDSVWLNDVPMFPENAIAEFGRAFKIVK